MTSSESLPSIEPWMWRSIGAADTWLLPDFSRDNDLFTRALQKSISNAQQQTFAPDFLPLSPAPTLSNVSGGSEPESASTKRKHAAVTVVGGGGKSSKRRSRSSKKSQTTFITADPADFRRMVQQVTGARYDGLVASIVKPEPHRPGKRLPCGPYDSLALPMLDTSASMSNHHQEALLTDPTLSGMGPDTFASFQPLVTVEAGGCAAAAVEFDPYAKFPTLESWKAM